MLTAGSFFQAEKGRHTQLALWRCGQSSRASGRIMDSLIFSRHSQRDYAGDVDETGECTEWGGLA